jgi:hypothetical protein
MKIGAITDSLGALSLDELLGTAAELGIERTGTRSARAKPCSDCASSMPYFFASSRLSQQRERTIAPRRKYFALA